MKIAPTNLERLESELRATMDALNCEPVPVYNAIQMWNLASAAGSLSWLYGTPEQLNDRHIETAFRHLHKKWTGN